METVIQSYSNKQIAQKVVDFCLGKYKFIFISGNGGSGKTTLSQEIASEVKSRGLEVNCIDTDDFLVDTEIRKSAKKQWIDINNITRESRYTSSFQESYHLNSLEGIINSLNQGVDSSFKPKKESESIEIKAEAPLTIIEGVGAAFLEKNTNTFGIFVTCDIDTEIDRRIKRARNGEHAMSRDEVEKESIERNDQFKSVILPERGKFDLELSSNEDYSLNIERNDLGV